MPVSPPPPQEDSRTTGSFTAGACAWMAFAVLAVAVRGVRWDEDYEFAQAVLGQVRYPAGHPLLAYASGLYTIQLQELALYMACGMGPLLANGLRNVLFLWATVLPAYFIAARMTGKARWGHVAAALLLTGMHVPFYSNYPIQVWPDLYSNGHIGEGWALLTLFLLLPRARGAHADVPAAYLALGLMPAVHIGQAPPLFLFGALYALARTWPDSHGIAHTQTGGRAYREPDSHDIAGVGETLRELRWLLAGLAISVALWCVVHALSVPAATAGAYAAAIPPNDVITGYMRHYASHRSIPWSTGHPPLAGALLLWLAALAGGRGNPAWRWCGAYLATTAALVWGTMALHAALGEHMPTALLSWMPYRLLNHASPVLVPMLLALLAQAPIRIGIGGTLLLLLAAVVTPLLAHALPESFFARYIVSQEALYFTLYGMAAAALFTSWKGAKNTRAWWLGVFTASLAALGVFHQFGAACVALGAAFAVLLVPRCQSTRWERLLPAAQTMLLVLLPVVLLLGQAPQRENLPVSDFEREVREVLAERGEGEAMLLVQPGQEGLQARLNHAVMTDMATRTWIPYRTDLAPAFWKIYREFYGIDFAAGPPNVPWYEVWAAKDLAEWQHLAQAYGFRYIYAPAFVVLDPGLERVIADDAHQLRRIPAPEEAQHDQ